MAGATVAESMKGLTVCEDKSSLQASEVASVKAAFPNRCRVMLNVGGYSSSITVQPENLDATIKFQLSAAYPSAIPEITIRSESLHEEHMEDLKRMLRVKAETLLGGPMIQALITEAEKELRTLGLRPGKASIVNTHSYIGKKTQKNKKQKKKPKSEDEEIESKLPPMKTADDVVKRIIWDGALEKDDFLVGYIDRFSGLVEKYFCAFSWEDLASVDYDVLAVPKHRIQYFKYKDIIIWDKVKRLDNVFGSAKGTKTIDVVIKDAQEAERREQESSGAQSTVETKEAIEELSNDLSASDSDDDDDDGITVTIGTVSGIGSGSGVVMSETTEKAQAGESGMQKEDPYWEDKLRPNYFLCVRITNPQIAERIGNIQDRLMEAEPLFAECCIPGVALHITLSCLGLDTAEQLQHCMETLKRIKPELEAALPTSLLDLHGVSNFYNRVIYAQVHYQEDFLRFCNLLKLFLREAGVQIRDGYEFVPHVTIMKTTRPVSRLRGTKNIHPKMYEQFLHENFGQQEITGISLCSMAPERRHDGFYLTPLELPLK